MNEANLLVEIAPPIAILRLNRPRQRNALSMDLMQELIRSFNEIGANKEVSAIILAGEGPAFSAGHDLKEMVGRDINEYRHIFDVCTDQSRP